LTKTILKKTTQKNKKTILEKKQKKNEKNKKKKHVGKVKVKFSTSSILKSFRKTL
jgi:hypothetical protein